jgi:hypothetical protein
MPAILEPYAILDMVGTTFACRARKKIKIIVYNPTKIDYIKSTTKDNAHQPSARLGEGSKIKESGLASA